MRRWQQVSRFVAYSFAKARRAKVGQLFLCYRVKELCEHFQASFEERFGVYEAQEPRDLDRFELEKA